MAISIVLFLLLTGQLVFGPKTPLFAHGYGIKAIKPATESASPLNESKNDFLSLLRRKQNISNDGSRTTQSTLNYPNGEENSIINFQNSIMKFFERLYKKAETLNFKDPDKMRSYIREMEENWNRTYISMTKIVEMYESENPVEEKNRNQTVDVPKPIPDITYSLDNIQESTNNDFSESTRLDTGIHTSSFDVTNTESTLVASRTYYPVMDNSGSPTGIHTLSPDQNNTESRLVASTTYYPVMDNSGSPTWIHTLPSDDNKTESRLFSFTTYYPIRESTVSATEVHTSSSDENNRESRLEASTTYYPVIESTGSPTGIYTLPSDENKTESGLVATTTYYPVMESSGSPTEIHTLPSDENKTESGLVASTTYYSVMENSGSPTGIHTLPLDENKTERMSVVFNTYNPVITSFHLKKKDVSEKNAATDAYELLNEKSYLTTMINQTEK